MESRLFILILLIGSFGCQSNNHAELSKIDRLEAALATDPNPANRKALIAAYQDTIAANPTPQVVNAEFYNKLANLQIETKSFVAALQTLMQGIKEAPKSSDISEKVWLLGTIYDQHLQQPLVASIIKKLYAQQYESAKHAAVAKQFLNNSNTDLSEDITALGSSMYDDKTHRVDYQAANDYIRICELYALVRPQDSKSPEYLHKAGETARSVRTFPKAVALYDWIYNQYPNFEKSAQALFLKAFTYDNELGDKETAKVLYEEFLEKYPTDDFADDTKFLLANLGKNDDEIIKSFGQ
ncbi:MAG: tetratricopeptide repeat protein [Bacteroidota bacterium]